MLDSPKNLQAIPLMLFASSVNTRIRNRRFHLCCPSAKCVSRKVASSVGMGSGTVMDPPPIGVKEIRYRFQTLL